MSEKRRAGASIGWSEAKTTLARAKSHTVEENEYGVGKQTYGTGPILCPW